MRFAILLGRRSCATGVHDCTVSAALAFPPAVVPAANAAGAALAASDGGAVAGFVFQ